MISTLRAWKLRSRQRLGKSEVRAGFFYIYFILVRTVSSYILYWYEVLHL